MSVNGALKACSLKKNSMKRTFLCSQIKFTKLYEIYLKYMLYHEIKGAHHAIRFKG